MRVRAEVRETRRPEYNDGLSPIELRVGAHFRGRPISPGVPPWRLPPKMAGNMRVLNAKVEIDQLHPPKLAALVSGTHA